MMYRPAVVVVLGIFILMNTGELVAETLYRESFDKGPGAWLTGKNKPAPKTLRPRPPNLWHRNIFGHYGGGFPLTWSQQDGRSGGFATAESPWYFDDNHGEFMWLHLIFFAYSDDVGLAGKDLRDAVVRVSLRGRDLKLNGTKLFFWIQGPAKEENRNWALTSEPWSDILLDGKWHDVSFTLAKQESKWTFMGHVNGGLSRKIEVRQPLSSGPGTLEPVLAGSHLDWGFLLCGVDPVEQPAGKIDIDEFRITGSSSR